MKSNVFCISYEAATLVQRDKSECKGSFKGVCIVYELHKMWKSLFFIFDTLVLFFFTGIF